MTYCAPLAAPSKSGHSLRHVFKNILRDGKPLPKLGRCALKWVMGEAMTNQSLRERFHLPESKSANVSQIITAALENGVLKADERAGTSRKFARYLPYWA